jgi:hypothetical protein
MALVMSKQDNETPCSYKEVLKREDAMDCLYSIIDLTEKHFTKNDTNFVLWMNVTFECLRQNFIYSVLLEKIIIIQEYIKNKSFMDEDAFININETIKTICDL